MVSLVKVSVPGGMTTAQRNALGVSLKVGTQIYNTDTGRYEITPDGGTTWQISAITSDITASGGLNNAYITNPNIILDGINPVNIQSNFTSALAYAAPVSGSTNVTSFIQGFSFIPAVDGFILSSQYNDSFFSSGSRIVEIYNRSTQSLILSTTVSKTDTLISGFRTKINSFPVYVQAGKQYVISVVVPASEQFNNVSTPAIAAITIDAAAFTAGASSPAFPATFVVGSFPRAGGFQFVSSSTYRDFQFNNTSSINNSFLEMTNSNIKYNTVLDTTSNFSSDIKRIMNLTSGGIPQFSACKASTVSDLSIEIVGNADVGTTAIIAISANTTTASGQIQDVWGLRIIKLISAGVITRGDQLRKATGVGNSGRVISSGISSGTFAVALQNAIAGQTFIAAIMMSTA